MIRCVAVIASPACVRQQIHTRDNAGQDTRFEYRGPWDVNTSQRKTGERAVVVQRSWGKPSLLGSSRRDSSKLPGGQSLASTCRHVGPKAGGELLKGLSSGGQICPSCGGGIGSRYLQVSFLGLCTPDLRSWGCALMKSTLCKRKVHFSRSWQ